MQCISVDAEDHLYVTEDFILTHNTLSDCFILLDEAQNCTWAQIKMLLTRIGEGSRCVVTGDTSQTDLRYGQSGLAEMVRVLSKIDGIGAHSFRGSDVVRHPLVGKIVRALDSYEAYSENHSENGHQTISRDDADSF